MYDDGMLISPKDMESAAKAYSESLKNEGFIFIKLDESKEDINNLATEIIKTLNTLKYIYQKNRSLEAKELLAMTDEALNFFNKNYGERAYDIFVVKRPLPTVFGLESNLVSKIILLFIAEEKKELLDLALLRLEKIKETFMV